MNHLDSVSTHQTLHNKNPDPIQNTDSDVNEGKGFITSPAPLGDSYRPDRLHSFLSSWLPLSLWLLVLFSQLPEGFMLFCEKTSA